MNNEPFVLERTFKAPLALLWATFTQAEHLKNWMSSPGATAGRNSMDFREGGFYHYELIAPDGQAFWGRWLFTEIVDHKRMVSLVSFSDEGRGITRHFMAPEWPLETLSNIEFMPVENGTKIRLQWSPTGSDPVALNTFEAGKPGMTQGWGGTMDQLDTYLEKVQIA